MVGLKLIERSIGMLSTVILARLLMPEDFGLVAMAMAVVALLEVLGQFGFDFALIRNRTATRAHYDSAWTVSVCYGVIAGVTIAGLAIPASNFFDEPRLIDILYVLGALAVLQGLENIGTVDFRKDFEFRKDFTLLLSKKLIAFIFTVALALIFRSYWALIAGTAISRIMGVVLSYYLHPYRPNINFSKAKELFGFSKWIVLTRVIQYLGAQGPTFLIARHMDATALGFYRVGREISTLPTSELIFPIMRAVFPGYSAVAHDKKLLAKTFLNVQAAIVTLTFPAGVGIALLADPIVMLLLGPNWLDAIPLIQILGFYGAISVLQATNFSIFTVLGKPHLSAAIRGFEVMLLLPSLGAALTINQSLPGVALTILAVHAISIPVSMYYLSKLIPISAKDRIKVTWRPLVATGAMLVSVISVTSAIPANGNGVYSSAILLSVAVLTGAVIYALSLYILWGASKKPDGPEKVLLELFSKWLGGARNE
tara:strand:+ start:11545 stop:12993 length:1449 start_codon:yes stop_codon:yes gene_type:complete